MINTAGTKAIDTILPSPTPHWVGDGFPVRTMFSPGIVQDRLSPFVLMDFGGPTEFEPTDIQRGVDTHPHKGFETVTVVFKGGVDHRDSAGNSGSIGPGDVQWMTAGSGVLHEEKHSAEFMKSGGTFEMAQLWVNLPARFKGSAPGYQTLVSSSIPVVEVDGGSVRAIAGEFRGTDGAAETFTPVILWDVQLEAETALDLPIPEGFSGSIFVRNGSITIGGQKVERHQMALLNQEGSGVSVEASENADLLVLGGEPIDEPVVAYGPFVMNTREEIQQAIAEVQSGKFGEIR